MVDLNTACYARTALDHWITDKAKSACSLGSAKSTVVHDLEAELALVIDRFSNSCDWLAALAHEVVNTLYAVDHEIVAVVALPCHCIQGYCLIVSIA